MVEPIQSEPASATRLLSGGNKTLQSAPPVFILGLHRSGTTILYEMLSRLTGWQTLQAWQAVKYDQLAAGKDAEQLRAEFVRELEATGMRTRGVDAIKAGPETKEEYCFILDNHGYGSRLTGKALPVFEDLCGTVRAVNADESPLLLKNPWDFGNAHTIRRLVPGARFIFIHRHPQQTINSMYRFLNDALQQPNAWMMMLSQRYRKLADSRWKLRVLGGMIRRSPSALVEGLIWWFGRQCDAYLKSIGQVPAAERIEITYDQLCDQPNATMKQLQQFLVDSAGAHMPAPSSLTRPMDFGTMISRREGRTDPHVAAKAAKIERRSQAYLKRMAQLETQPAETRPAVADPLPS